MRLVCSRLGIEIEELKDAGCTGAREMRGVDAELHLAMNARILALAEQRNADLMVVCDTCLLNLTEVNHRLRRQPQLLQETNAVLGNLGYTYRASVEVKHFLWVLLFDIGPNALRKHVVRPLTGLRVAPFYGCHIVRPQSLFGAKAGDTSDTLETLCEVLGCQPVDYKGRTDCCGFHVSASDDFVPIHLAGSHVRSAASSGAHVMLTPCPLCHTVLDSFQPAMERHARGKLSMPVLHLAQIVGLAMGMEPKALKVDQHVVPFLFEPLAIQAK